MLNIVKFILDLIAISLPAKARNTTKNDEQLIVTYIGTVKIDYEAIVYPDMKNERCMGKFNEIIVSKPIQYASYNPNYLLTQFNHSTLSITSLNFCSTSTESGLIVCLLVKDTKELIIFFLYPTYLLLLRMFLNEYKSYISNIKFLGWQLEQLLNIIEYIKHNDVYINNLFFAKNNLLINREHCYGLQIKI